MVGYPYPVKSTILWDVYGRPRQLFSPANWICWIVAGGDAPWIQVASLPLWIAAGLPASPEDHSSVGHITWGESGRLFVGLGLQW